MMLAALCHWKFLGIAVLAAPLAGCAMCASNLDPYYTAYGGKRARADMIHGRVGSIIDPAPETAESVMVDPSTLTDPTPAEPTPAETGGAGTGSGEGAQSKKKDEGPTLDSPFDPKTPSPESKAEPAAKSAETNDDALDTDGPNDPDATEQDPSHDSESDAATMELTNTLSDGSSLR